MTDKIKFSNAGGCTAKIGPDILSGILGKLPKSSSVNLIVGYDSSDDAAVYKISEDTAVVQTLDFFTPIVDDPYLFGKIAAANALSDIYAMGGEVKLALNILCYPENGDLDALAEILRGGAEKIIEAGGVICGGHSVNDPEPKYGLSVMGTVNPNRVLKNNNCLIGDKIILTKPLGVGIVTTAYKMGEASEESYQKAVKQMETLNKYAAEAMRDFEIHAATDVTGFGFLGHLNEMVTDTYTISVDAGKAPYISEAYEYANEFFLTAAGQKNRNHLIHKVEFSNVSFAVQEILFDPQTSGGLIISIAGSDAEKLIKRLEQLNLGAAIVGEVVSREKSNILVRG